MMNQGKPSQVNILVTGPKNQTVILLNGLQQASDT